MLTITSLLLLTLSLKSQAQKVDCSNIEAVAKEAIETQLSGAGYPSMGPKCIAKQAFKYFKPHEASLDSDESNLAHVIWFHPSNDKYSITRIERDGEEKLQIHAVFKIGEKRLRTTYTYEPMEYLQSEAGICGLIYNDHHEILRSDCKKGSN